MTVSGGLACLKESSTPFTQPSITGSRASAAGSWRAFAQVDHEHDRLNCVALHGQVFADCYVVVLLAQRADPTSILHQQEFITLEGGCGYCADFCLCLC